MTTITPPHTSASPAAGASPAGPIPPARKTPWSDSSQSSAPARAPPHSPLRHRGT